MLAAAGMVSPLASAEEASWGISGWINESAIYWDDGDQSDISQVSDNGTTLGSRITLSGSTPLAGTGLTAGFEVILEPLSSNTPLIFSNQDTIETFNGGDIGVLGSSLNVGGAWGKLTFGLQSMPTDNIAVLADPSLTLWSSISPVFRGNGFFVRDTGDLPETPGFVTPPEDSNNAVWGDFLECLTAPGLSGAGGIGLDCNGIYRNGIRYDLPAFGPVSVAVGYANDDVFDIAIKYSGQIGGLIANVHGGYAYNADGGVNTTDALGNSIVVGDGSDNFQIQFGLMDPDSGVFGTLAYQQEETEDGVAGFGDDTDAWWTKIGIKRNFTGFGDTAFSFQYGQYEDQYGNINDSAAVTGLTARGPTPRIDGSGGIVTGSEVQRVGFSVDQYFGSKLIIYGAYENLSLDVDGSNAAVENLFDDGEDLDIFSLGLTYFF